MYVQRGKGLKELVPDELARLLLRSSYNSSHVILPFHDQEKHKNKPFF